MDDAAPAGTLRFLDLAAEGLRRRFILVVPRARLAEFQAQRLAEMRLGPASDSEAADPRLAALRRRLEAAALTDARQRAGAEAFEQLATRLGLLAAGAPRLDPLPTPEDGDLVLHAEVETLALPEPPDPAALTIARPVIATDPAAASRALATLADQQARWVELPAGEPAAPGDALVCDIEATLPPPANRLPNPEMAGAEPGRLPEGWAFGNNNSGLAGDVVAIAPDASPPHLTLHVHGTAAAAGQTFVLAHPMGGLPAAPGSTWAGSVALRLAGGAVGLRGAKLRLVSRSADGRQLQRKDAAAPAGAGFARAYVSDTFSQPETASLRLAILLDHDAGPVDFTIDIAGARLTEGLDLGQDVPLPLPEISGQGLRIGPGGSDPAGLLPQLLGLAAGDRREIAVLLPQTMPDAAQAGREAQVALRVGAVLRRQVPPVDDALATTLGFAGLAGLRAALDRRIAERRSALEAAALRHAALETLLAATPAFALPEEAVRGELAAIWPRLAAEAEARGAPPPAQEDAIGLAARRVRLRLLVQALAARHGLVPSEADLAAAAAAQPDASAMALQAQALEDRAVAFVLARATVTDRAAEPAAAR